MVHVLGERRRLVRAVPRVRVLDKSVAHSLHLFALCSLGDVCSNVKAVTLQVSTIHATDKVQKIILPQAHSATKQRFFSCPGPMGPQAKALPRRQ